MRLNLSTISHLHPSILIPMAVDFCRDCQRGISDIDGLGATNLALNRPAVQSSTYSANLAATAAKAVDGNTGGDYGAGQIAHTNLENQPWWQVDLGAISDISDVRIWNRTDRLGERLKNFYVLVSNDFMGDPSLNKTIDQAGVAAIPVAGPVGESITVGVNRPGRYLRIQLAGQDYLQLAEVEVFEKEVPAAQAPSQSQTTTSTDTTQTSSVLDSITSTINSLFSTPAAPVSQTNPVGGSNFSAPVSGTSFFSRKFSLFGFQIPYLVPIAIGAFVILSKKKR